MTIAEALAKNDVKTEYKGKSIFIRLICYENKAVTEEFYYGIIVKLGKNSLTLKTSDGELIFPAEREAIVPSKEEYILDGKKVKPDFYAVFSLYGKNSTVK